MVSTVSHWRVVVCWDPLRWRNICPHPRASPRSCQGTTRTCASSIACAYSCWSVKVISGLRRGLKFVRHCCSLAWLLHGTNPPCFPLQHCPPQCSSLPSAPHFTWQNCCPPLVLGKPAGFSAVEVWDGLTSSLCANSLLSIKWFVVRHILHNFLETCFDHSAFYDFDLIQWRIRGHVEFVLRLQIFF